LLSLLKLRRGLLLHDASGRGGRLGGTLGSLNCSIGRLVNLVSQLLLEVVVAGQLPLVVFARPGIAARIATRPHHYSGSGGTRENNGNHNAAPVTAAVVFFSSMLNCTDCCGDRGANNGGVGDICPMRGLVTC